jgi:hypothetical protein
MPHRSLEALAQSALFTATILPEQLDAGELAELAAHEKAAVKELQMQGGRFIHIDADGNMLPHETVAAVRRAASFRRSAAGGPVAVVGSARQNDTLPLDLAGGTSSGKSSREAFAAAGVKKAASLSLIQQLQQPLQTHPAARCSLPGIDQVPGVTKSLALHHAAAEQRHQLQEVEGRLPDSRSVHTRAVSFKDSAVGLLEGVGAEQKSASSSRWPRLTAHATPDADTAVGATTTTTAALEGLTCYRGSCESGQLLGEHFSMPRPPHTGRAEPVLSPDAETAADDMAEGSRVVLYGSALDDQQLGILHQALTTVTENVQHDDEEERLFGSHRSKWHMISQTESRGTVASMEMEGTTTPAAPYANAESSSSSTNSRLRKGGSWRHSIASLQQRFLSSSFSGSFIGRSASLAVSEATPGVMLAGGGRRGRRATAVQCLDECMALGLLTSSRALDGTSNISFSDGGSNLPAWAVIPTLPSSIYEHTIAAVPNFEQKVSPKTSCTFLIVNLFLVLALGSIAVMEVHMS